MKAARAIVAASLLVSAGPTLSAAGLPIAQLERDTPVDFAKEVVPFLRKNCFACHNEKKSKATARKLLFQACFSSPI
ncbi:MAG: hypothetical protein HRU37_00010 [Roseibacillus sp.]|nr:hypothetical protein [Roseibacillus sp.]